MANPEHLMLIQRSVNRWNKWRIHNFGVTPDLSGAHFGRKDLSHAFLDNVDLRRAYFREAIMIGADLSGAILTGSILDEADLSEAKLIEADLTKAHLNDAKLMEADLSVADLSGAHLRRARLCNATLDGAKLIGADLSEANLAGANFTDADLTGADLSAACLIAADLTNAILTGTQLWQIQRAEWSIEGIICEYAYWDLKGKEKSVYSPGDFEKLHSDKTLVRLFYKDGFEPLEFDTLPALIKFLEESHPMSGLRMVSVKEASGGAVVELAIEDDSDKSPEQLKQLKTEIEATAQRAIEYERKFLTEEKQRLRLEGEVKQLTSFVDKLILRPSINVQGDYMGDTYNVSGQAGAVGQNAHAHDMTFNQIVNHFEKSIDLPALANQLAELREEIANRQDSSPQAIIAQGEAAKAEIAAKEGNTSKVVEYLKAGGQGLLDIAKETGKELLTAAIKAALGMQ